MIPDHCKDVSVRHVNFKLTEENIASHIKGKKAYTRTDHIILLNGNDAAILRVIKAGGKELFRPIVNYEIIALPEETVFVRDEKVDVLNPSHMARIASEYPDKIVVVEGLFNHVSYIKDLKPLKLRVLDVVPPYPSKMSFLVERALSSGMIDIPVLTVEQEIDLNELAKNSDSPGIIFPCAASGLRSNKKSFFLDAAPGNIDVECDLIGCSLSRRIYRALYKKDIRLINICPWDLAPRDGIPTIVKCCKVKEGHVIDGNIIVVQWGATVREVIEAINDFFNKRSGTPAGPEE